MPEYQRHPIVTETVRILSEERQKQKLSMTMLAAKAGLSQSIISLMEKGHRSPTLETVQKIADVLDVKLSVILAKAEKRKK